MGYLYVGIVIVDTLISRISLELGYLVVLFIISVTNTGQLKYKNTWKTFFVKDNTPTHGTTF